MLRPVGQQGLAADEHGVAVDDALHALALDVLERLGGGQVSDLAGGAGGDGLGDRVLGGVLQRPGEPQQIGATPHRAR